MRSKVTLGNGAEAEMVAMRDKHGRIARPRKSGFTGFTLSELDVDPESSMLAAAIVADTMLMAAGGRGWL